MSVYYGAVAIAYMFLATFGGTDLLPGTVIAGAVLVASYPDYTLPGGMLVFYLACFLIAKFAK